VLQLLMEAGIGMTVVPGLLDKVFVLCMLDVVHSQEEELACAQTQRCGFEVMHMPQSVRFVP